MKVTLNEPRLIKDQMVDRDTEVDLPEHEARYLLETGAAYTGPNYADSSGAGPKYGKATERNPGNPPKEPIKADDGSHLEKAPRQPVGAEVEVMTHVLPKKQFQENPKPDDKDDKGYENMKPDDEAVNKAKSEFENAKKNAGKGPDSLERSVERGKHESHSGRR